MSGIISDEVEESPAGLGAYSEVEQFGTLNKLDDHIHEMGGAMKDYAAIDEIADKMEQSETGFGEATGNAVLVAVEAMLARQGLRTNLAFEEFSTQRKRLDQHQVAVEGIKDVLKKIWDKIVEMVQKLVAWFKGVFARFTSRRRALDAKMDKLTNIVQEIKKEEAKPEKKEVKKELPHQAGSHQDDANFINSPHIFNWITVKGEVPEFTEFASWYDAHIRDMKHLYEVVERDEKVMLDGTTGALDSVYKDGNAFKAHYDKVYSAAWTVPFQMPVSKDQGRFGHLPSGVVVHEFPLVFGEKALWRTALDKQSTVSPSELHFAVMSRTGAPVNPADHTRVKKLDNDQITHIADAAGAHKKTVINPQDDRQQEVVKTLDNIERKLKAIETRSNSDTKQMKYRSSRIHDLILTVSRLVAHKDISLIQYDLNVFDAAISWATLSYS